MKTVFLINGFRLNKTTTHPDFNLLRSVIESKGYRVAQTDIVWNHKTVSRFSADFINLYNRQKTEHNIIIGNSFGAMVAFLSAPKLKPDTLILCSISGFFKEDLHMYDESYLLNRFGKRRLDDLRALSADVIAEQINENNIETIFLYGEKEKSIYPRLVERVKVRAHSVNNSRLLEVPNAGHPMYEPDYVEGIKGVLS